MVLDCGVTVVVIAVKGGQVRLGFIAPDDVKIDREEAVSTVDVAPVSRDVPG